LVYACLWVFVLILSTYELKLLDWILQRCIRAQFICWFLDFTCQACLSLFWLGHWTRLALVSVLNVRWDCKESSLAGCMLDYVQMYFFAFAHTNLNFWVGCSTENYKKSLEKEVEYSFTLIYWWITNPSNIYSFIFNGNYQKNSDTFGVSSNWL